jgi:hypothetical protein
VLERVVGAGHQFESIEATYGTPIRDRVVAFLIDS